MKWKQWSVAGLRWCIVSVNIIKQITLTTNEKYHDIVGKEGKEPDKFNEKLK